MVATHSAFPPCKTVTIFAAQRVPAVALVQLLTTLMKRFLIPKGSAADVVAKHTADKAEQAVAKKARLSGQQQAANSKGAGAATSSPATTLLHDRWTDLGEQARVGYWPRLLSGMSQRALRSLLDDIQWQQV